MSKLIEGTQYEFDSGNIISSPSSDTQGNKIATVYVYDNGGPHYPRCLITQEVDGVVYAGVPVTISGLSIIDVVSVCFIDTDKILVTACENSTYAGKCCVGTITETSVTFGSWYTFADGTYTGGGTGYAIRYEIESCKLNTDKAVVTYGMFDGAYYRASAVVASVSGTSVSFGTVNILTSLYTSLQVSLNVVSMETDIAVFSSGRSGSTTVTMRKLSVSGTTITNTAIGSISCLSGYGYHGICKLTNTDIVIIFNDSTIRLSAQIFTTSGAFGAAQVIGVVGMRANSVKCIQISTGYVGAVFDLYDTLTSTYLGNNTTVIGVDTSTSSVSAGTITSASFSGYPDELVLTNTNTLVCMSSASGYTKLGETVFKAETLATKTGELHMNGRVLRLVSTADAEYSSLRIANGGTIHAADLVKYDTVFGNYPVRVQHPIHGKLTWREE